MFTTAATKSTKLLQAGDGTLPSDTLNDVVGNLENAKAAIDNLVSAELHGCESEY